MRIFFDGLIFSMQRHGGISRLYNEVLPRLVSLAPDMEGMLYLRRKLKAELLPSAPRLEYLHEKSVYPSRWIYGRARAQSELLTRAYRRVCPDLFHTTYFSLPRVIRTPYVLVVHDTMDEIYASSIKSRRHDKLLEFKRQCIHLADLIFSVSNSTTADLLRFHKIDAAKVITVRLGVSPQFRIIQDEQARVVFRRRFGLERPFFLYVGNRNGVKNFRRFLHAYAYSNCGKEIDLLAVGGEPAFSEQEQVIVREYHLERSVKHIPELDNESLAIAYNLAEAFVYPSLYEGFGLPILEAMACGTPVIASRVASIPEVAGDAALYVEPEEIGDMAAALEQVLQIDYRTTMVQAGIRQAQRFSWDETARTMLDAYRRLS